MKEHQINYQERIIQDPKIMVGKPVVRGTRIPVELVLKRLSQDLDLKTLFESYPRLTEEDVKASLEYAERVIKGRKARPRPEHQVASPPPSL